MKLFRNNSALILAVVAGVGLGVGAMGLSENKSGLLPVPAKSPQDLSMAFREISNRVLPAVVSIRTVSRGGQAGMQMQEMGPGLGGDPFAEEFLKDFFGQNPQFEDMFRNRGQGRRFRQQPHEQRQQGAGSGFILDPQGVAMTNAHVVANADSVVVVMDDGREFKADSWLADERSDIAVVRFTPDAPLTALALGDSDTAHVGDWVLALGNPFDVGTTVTAGIISARGRAPHINARENFLQTDAAINPGNSGGPLVDMSGQVVGINTAISTSSGGYDGVGFAIPANMARWIADQLLQHGSVKRAYLGIAMQEMNRDLREQFGAPANQGALVGDVSPDSPAEKGGLQSGDIILEFAGQKVASQVELQGIVERLAPGQSYVANVLRDRKPLSLEIPIAAMPDDYGFARNGRPRVIPNEEQAAPQAESVKNEAIGIEVTELTDDLRTENRIPQGQTGVVIVNVLPGSIAENAGLQPGDLIQKFGATRKIESATEFAEATKQVDLEQGVLLLVRRGNGTMFVTLKAE